MIDNISADSLLSQLEQLRSQSSEMAGGAKQAGKAEGSEFKDVFSDLIGQVDQAQKQADSSLKSLAMGDKNTSIHEVILKMEQADISFSLMSEIRNKLVSAYKELLSGQ
jgi:flagellar hook-basal body complex protein FliE